MNPPNKSSITPKKQKDTTVSHLKQCESEVIDGKDLSKSSDFANLLEEISFLKAENKTLKHDIEILHSLFRTLDNRSRQKNLVFGGIKTNGNNYADAVQNFMFNVLKLDHPPPICAATPIGKCDTADGRTPPILVEFAKSQELDFILSKAKVLKGTRFFISRDVCKKSRIRRGKLTRVRREIATVDPSINATVKGTKLVVNNQEFVWDDSRGLVTSAGDDGSEVIRRRFRVNLDPLTILNDQGGTDNTSNGL